MRKVCKGCNQSLSIDNFYKNRKARDGRRGKCKQCENVDRRKREGITSPPRIPIKEGTKHSRYNKTAKGKARSKRYQLRHPEKRKAHNVVSHEIQAGRMKPAKKLMCSCGKPAKQYHHYKGYLKENRLDVIPLCIPCHRKEHQES